MPVTENIVVVLDDILGIVERHFKLMGNYCSNPPPDFSFDDLARFLARTYGFVQKGQEMQKDAKEAAKEAQGGVVGEGKAN